MSAPDEPGPALIAAGGAFLPGSVCDPIWRVLRAELDRRRADGGRVRPEVAEALNVLRAAALAHLTSATGHAERTREDIGASSPEQALITTDQLAARLGVTPRHARRIAEDEQVRPVARGLWHADDATALEVARTRR